MAKNRLEDAFQALQNEEYKLSAELYKKSMNYLTGSKHFVSFNNKGVAEMNLKDYSSAARSFKQASENNEKHFESLHNHAMALVCNNDALSALKSLDEALAVNSSFYPSLCLKSLILSSCSDFEKEDVPTIAINLSEKCIQLEPNNYLGYFSRGLVYLRLKSFEKALSSFEVAVSKYDGGSIPSDKSLVKNIRSCVLNLALEYKNRGQIDLGIEYLNKGKRLLGDDTSLLYNLGIFYFQTGNFSDSLIAFEKICSLKEETLKEDALLNMGLLHIKFSSYEDAIEKLEACIQLNPKNQSARYNLALCYHKRGENRKAFTNFKICSELNPNNTHALHGKQMLELSYSFEQVPEVAPASDLQLLLSQPGENFTLDSTSEAAGFLPDLEVESKEGIELSNAVMDLDLDQTVGEKPSSQYQTPLQTFSNESNFETAVDATETVEVAVKVYSIEELKNRKAGKIVLDGVLPEFPEESLTDEAFEKVFAVTREEFNILADEEKSKKRAEVGI
eukprot:snap_masked-scaffold_18-processed-gene-6.30-mRNA-1 protein AED:1.00 eAED:1.00 QI:0/-1/0/0/-1/1/1/0/504